MKHETAHKAPEKIAALSTQQLLSAFETTEFLSCSPELSITRGWLMDELEKRNPAAFNAWLDSKAPEDSNLRRFFRANSICYDCKKMCTECNGTESNVYTGCIYILNRNPIIEFSIRKIRIRCSFLPHIGNDPAVNGNSSVTRQGIGEVGSESAHEKDNESANSGSEKGSESKKSQMSIEMVSLLNRLLKDVKICDPAIGSGAFPMGLLNELLECREVLALRLIDAGKEDEVFADNNSAYGGKKE